MSVFSRPSPPGHSREERPTCRVGGLFVCVFLNIGWTLERPRHTPSHSVQNVHTAPRTSQG
eukprot:4923301-Prymnesium_polylepis.1